MFCSVRLRSLSLRRMRPLAMAIGLVVAGLGPAWAEEEFVYTVRPGDNPWTITEHYLLDMSYWPRLQQHNRIADARRIPPGSRLFIPMEWLRLRGVELQLVSWQGRVERFSAGQWTLLDTKPVAMAAGQRLRTGSSGRATLSLGQGTLIEVRPKSELLVRKLPGPGEGGADVRIEIELLSGGLDNAVPALRSTGRALDIVSPSAVTAVRGTTFTVRVEADRTWSEVAEGEVDVFNPQGVTRLISAQGSVTIQGQAPSAAQALPALPDLSGTPAVLDTLPCQTCIAPHADAAGHVIEWWTEEPDSRLEAAMSSEGAVLPDPPVPDGTYRLHVRASGPMGLQGAPTVRPVRLARQVPKGPDLDRVERQGDRIRISWSRQAEENEPMRLQMARDPAFERVTADRTVHGRDLTLMWPTQAGTYHVRLGRYRADQPPVWGPARTIQVRPMPVPQRWSPLHWVENLSGHGGPEGSAR